MFNQTYYHPVVVMVIGWCCVLQQNILITKHHIIDPASNGPLLSFALLTVVKIAEDFFIMVCRFFSGGVFFKFFTPRTAHTLCDSLDGERRFTPAHTDHRNFHVFESYRSATRTWLHVIWTVEFEGSSWFTITWARCEFNFINWNTLTMIDFLWRQFYLARAWFYTITKKMKNETN